MSEPETKNPPNPDAEMKAEQVPSAEASTDNNSSSEVSDSKTDQKSKEEITNDGVKILEEVFGKASVGDDKEEAKNQTETPVNGEPIIGPEPPKEEEYDPKELEKAEEYKTQGNDYFKSK